jgi:hypothetical protein
MRKAAFYFLNKSLRREIFDISFRFPHEFCLNFFSNIALKFVRHCSSKLTRRVPRPSVYSISKRRHALHDQLRIFTGKHVTTCLTPPWLQGPPVGGTAVRYLVSKSIDFLFKGELKGATGHFQQVTFMLRISIK